MHMTVSGLNRLTIQEQGADKPLMQTCQQSHSCCLSLTTSCTPPKQGLRVHPIGTPHTQDVVCETQCHSMYFVCECLVTMDDH